MAQQVVHMVYTLHVLLYRCLPHSQQVINTVVGDDYEAVTGEELVFNRGDTRACHNIDILQDDICESDLNETFFSDLSYVSGEQPITLSPPTAQIIIDDSDEPECKLK